MQGAEEVLNSFRRHSIKRRTPVCTDEIVGFGAGIGRVRGYDSEFSRREAGLRTFRVELICEVKLDTSEFD